MTEDVTVTLVWRRIVLILVWMWIGVMIATTFMEMAWWLVVISLLMQPFVLVVGMVVLLIAKSVRQ